MLEIDTNITTGTCHYMDVKYQAQWVTFRRTGPTDWERLYGESWETEMNLVLIAKLELAFQKHCTGK